MNPPASPAVMLVGVGVVGRAIAKDHLRADIPVWLVDRDESILQSACDQLCKDGHQWVTASPWGARVDQPIIAVLPSGHDENALPTSTGESMVPWLVIESIAEQLPIKQSFFADVMRWFDCPPVCTTNTSTLSIHQIAAAMPDPSRLAGLHFFMPVVGRDAVEIIPHDRTADDVIQTCQQHAGRLGKASLIVGDGPGFVVNRMLAPYLNLSMWLVCGGVRMSMLDQAAQRFGMPMSPLGLIELIGPSTAFDAGRVVWQAFPSRLNPSPLLPAMVKRDRKGKRGWNDPEVADLIERYRHDQLASEDCQADRIAQMMATVMRIESGAIQRDGIADAATIDAAMTGGLRWRATNGEWSFSRWVDRWADESLATRYPQVPEWQTPG